MNLTDIKSTDRYKGFCIYVITNTTNNKVYVGHTKRFGNRIKLHISRSRNPKYKTPLYNAIRKYGLDVFMVSVVKFGIETFDLSANIEIEKIKEYNSIVPNGYNLTTGGEGNPGYKHTEEWKKRQSKIMKGRKYFLGFKHTEEWKNLVSKRMMGNTFARNVKHSAEFKEARRQQMLLNNVNRKFTEEERIKVFYAYVNMENRSQRKIAKQFGCSQDTIKKIFAKYKHLTEHSID